MNKINNAHWTQYAVGVTLIFFAAIASFAIVPQLDGFKDSLQVLKSASLPQVGLAALATLTSCFFAAVLYICIAERRLSIWKTFIVQLSGLFLNRILPAGVGGIGLNVWYLKRAGHSLTQAAVIASFGNLLGLLGHLLLLTIFVIFDASFLGGFTFNSSQITFVTILLVALITGSLLFRHSLDKRLRAIRHEIGRFINRIVAMPLRFTAALLTSMALTLSSVTGFWLACNALDIHITLTTAFFIYTLAVMVGTVTPTPGGLGGFEAGLYTGLVTLKVDQSSAFAAALLFRLTSYWFGLVIGAIASLCLKRILK